MINIYHHRTQVKKLESAQIVILNKESKKLKNN